MLHLAPGTCARGGGAMREPWCCFAKNKTTTQRCARARDVPECKFHVVKVKEPEHSVDEYVVLYLITSDQLNIRFQISRAFLVHSPCT